MPLSNKQRSARPVFRYLAGAVCPVFVLLAALTAFPQLFGWDAESDWLGTTLLIWGGLFFGTILIKGKIEPIARQRLLVFVAARKYVAGTITIEEFGSRTRAILGDANREPAASD